MYRFYRVSGVCCCVASLLFYSGTITADQHTPKIVASIAPIHSLVAQVTANVTTPKLLLPANISPHHFSIQPSQARAIADADLIVWVGPALESALAKPLSNLTKQQKLLEIMSVKDLKLLPVRDEDDFAIGIHSVDRDDHDHHNDKDHDDHDGHDHHSGKGHDDHDDHDDHSGKGHDDHDDHDHHSDKGHDDHDDHDHHSGKGHDDHDHHGSIHDAHVWLDPANAVVILQLVAQQLTAIDPANADTYQRNMQQAVAQTAQLQQQLRRSLSAYRSAKFVVFHDAYQYFEQAAGLTASGVVHLHPNSTLGAARVAALHNSIGDIDCIFTEPQFNHKLVDQLTATTGIKTAQLDPLGANLQPGTNLYPQLMRHMVDAFKTCLSNSS